MEDKRGGRRGRVPVRRSRGGGSKSVGKAETCYREEGGGGKNATRRTKTDERKNPARKKEQKMKQRVHSPPPFGKTRTLRF